MLNGQDRTGTKGHSMTTMERIVVGGDHTPAATAALRWAVGEAARTGACVVVVHAFDVAGRADLALERDLDRARLDARYRTQSWVVEVLGDLDSRVPVVVSTPDGSVARSLTRAGRDAQLVVIGQPGDGPHRDLASVLARICPCPVLTIAGETVAAV
jgi:nucleotide-binding universal stress UspA family protein